VINDAIEALKSFENVKRRMELIGRVNDIDVYDDFAHHPTAIATTLQGLRNKVKTGRILAAVDLRSNTMKMGYHKNSLADATELADQVLFHLPEAYDWTIDNKGRDNLLQLGSTESVLQKLIELAKPGDTIVIMSNGSFDGIHQKVLDQLA
jgi:UDP-N-acetylmuramate: L-alanyl-gamma-D-glutamyl-meso-diaminopimelate ligase